LSRSVFIVAAEASGDALAGDVIDSLRRREPDIVVRGVGLAQMAARGVPSEADISGLSVLGLFEGLMAFGRVKRAVSAIADAIETSNPDAVVLVDSWGIMWRLGRELSRRGVRAARIKLVGPQIWATRPGRARTLARWFDHLICIHAFEVPYYQPHGLSVTVMGNPALDRSQRGDGQAFAQAAGLKPDARVIGLLPGSRPSEVRRVAPVLADACRRLVDGRPDRKVVCVVSPSVRGEVEALAARFGFPAIMVTDEAGKADAFACMEIALACSGTVTTELAVQGVSVIVGYKVGWLTWALARLFLMRSRFICLLNVAAGRAVAPEFVQTRLTAGRLAAAAERLLSDPETLERQRAGQRAALQSMAFSERSASDIASETILRIASERHARSAAA
jgi:lipid-A-disaccharide synthase